MNTIDFAIEQAVYDKKIEMKTFSINNPELNALYNGNSCPRKHILDMSNIMRPQERRFLADYIAYKTKTTYAKPINFQNLFFSPLQKIIKKYNNDNIQQYLLTFTTSQSRQLRRIAISIKTYIDTTNTGTKVLSKHVIYVKNASMAPERLNRHINTISFQNVINPVTQSYLESYTLALINQTDLSISTIFGRIRYLKDIFNKYTPDCLHWTNTNIELCFKNIMDCPWSDRSKQDAIYAICNFFNYLEENNIILSLKASLLAQEISFPKLRIYKKTAPDEYVLLQIFNHLHKATSFVRLSFLILYCTGMRISELVLLRKNCLEQQNEQFYLHYYQSKMRKEVCNAIPTALAEMIAKYIKNNPSPVNYVFTNKQNKPFTTGTFRRHIKNFCSKINIQNSDGSPYIFTPHQYRHLMAKRMRQQGIPLRFIQEQLHHYTQYMTLFYVEHFDDERIEEMTKWLEDNDNNNLQSNENMKLEINRKILLETAILPNGVCTRLPILGPCESCNKCIDCTYFRTSYLWRPVLEKQQQRLIKFIEYAKSQGWTKAADNSIKTLNNLNKILRKIKKGKHQDE